MQQGQNPPPAARSSPPATYAEAPASLNIRYYTAEGFNCQLTLRGLTGTEVLGRANAAISQLIEGGCTPEPPGAAHNGTSAGPAPSGAQPGEPPANWCPVHNCEMPKRTNGSQVWYSHKVGDSWCRGGKK